MKSGYLGIAAFVLAGSCQALDYGSSVDGSQTTFRVYATDASRVELVLYASEKGDVQSVIPLEKEGGSDTLSKDSWSATVSSNLDGQWYKYRVFGGNSIPCEVGTKVIACDGENLDAFAFHPVDGWMADTTAPGYMDSYGAILDEESKDGKTWFHIEKGQASDYAIEVVKAGEYPTRLQGFAVSDPYCQQMSTFENRCQVVSFGDEFEADARPKAPGFIPGHVIHEVHLKDLTWLLPGIPAEIRGTYAALGHPQTLKKLRDMHVTTLELLPLHAFDRNAAPPGEINYWGYMTKGFFALHEPYASVDGNSRHEFRAAVDALHQAGISVVMDVVYNHTSEGDHRGPNVSFKNLARNEYFRMHDAKKGYYLNTAGCGNVVRSESPVARKLILDSLKFWHEVYGIDGFRFDLAAAIDAETLRQAREVLGPDVLMTGEPWVAEGSTQWNRGDLNEIHFGKWNDQYRKAVKGGWGAPGFINGQPIASTMEVLVRGEHGDFGGSGSVLNTSWGSINPYGIINEVEVHDGPTLYDHLQHFHISDEVAHARMKLAHALLLLSVHTPILHYGQEFARTKKGNENSYNQDSDVNWIDYSLQNQNRNLNDFTVALKKIRQRFDAFHHTDRIQDDRFYLLRGRDLQDHAFGWKLKGSDHEILVLVNGSIDTGVDFDLPAGTWTVLSDGNQASERGLGVQVTNGHYYVHPTQAIVLKRPQE